MTPTTALVISLVSGILVLATGIVGLANGVITYRAKSRELKDAAAKATVQQPPAPAISIGPPAPPPRIIFRNDWVNSWRYRDWREW